MHLVENDPVKTLFQDEPLPADYDATLRRILNDNWILLRVQDSMTRHFAAVAIARAHENEFTSLRKRVTLALNPPAPIPSLAESRAAELVARAKGPKRAGFIPAIWSVMTTTNDFGEKRYFLAGKCEKCGQEARVLDVPAYSEHCGAVEAVPEEAVKRLRQAQGHPTTASGDELYEAMLRGDQPATDQKPATS